MDWAVSTSTNYHAKKASNVKPSRLKDRLFLNLAHFARSNVSPRRRRGGRGDGLYYDQCDQIGQLFRDFGKN